jgi:hypothetical protein
MIGQLVYKKKRGIFHAFFYPFFASRSRLIQPSNTEAEYWM